MNMDFKAIVITLKHMATYRGSCLRSPVSGEIFQIDKHDSWLLKVLWSLDRLPWRVGVAKFVLAKVRYLQFRIKFMDWPQREKDVWERNLLLEEIAYLMDSLRSLIVSRESSFLKSEYVAYGFVRWLYGRFRCWFITVPFQPCSVSEFDCQG